MSNFCLPTCLYTSRVLEQCVTAVQTKTSGHIIAPAYIHIMWQPICTHIPTAKKHTQYACSQCKTRYVLLQPGKQFVFIISPCFIPMLTAHLQVVHTNLHRLFSADEDVSFEDILIINPTNDQLSTCRLGICQCTQTHPYTYATLQCCDQCTA